MPRTAKKKSTKNKVVDIRKVVLQELQKERNVLAYRVEEIDKCVAALKKIYE